MKRRILLLGSQITVGGAQRVLMDQAEWFQENGYGATVVFYYDKDGLLESWQKQHVFPIQTLGNYQRGKKAANALALPGAMIRLAGIIRRFRPDIIETFTHDAALVGLPVAAALGVPVRIAAHHGRFAGLSALKSRLHSALINSGACDRLVCVSERAAVQALEEGIAQNKIVRIRNGILPFEKDAAIREEIRAKLGIAPSDQLVFSVGRLVPEKAQHFLIQAAAKVTENHPNIKFMIAGEGPLHGELARMISGLNLENRFSLLGNRKDVPMLLNAADLFVLYSETEGMPISLMEAMSIGLPVISSDLAGCRELIGESEAGVLVPFGSADRLATELTALLNDRDRCVTLGAAAAAKIRAEFSLAQSMNEYRQLFNEIGQSKIRGSA